jgi:putative ABC transport system permease protein
LVNYPAAIKLPGYIALNSALLKITPNTDLDTLQQSLQQQIQQNDTNLSANIRSAKVLQQTMAKQKHTLTLMLGLIGSIALLVGGIGIMNVMLVSVTERKKEIGLRLAIGATQRHIQYLFLTEAAILGIFGGISGSVLGELMTWIISYFTEWQYSFLLEPLIFGLVISILTSIFFGFYPARQASRLNPIEVLRSE